MINVTNGTGQPHDITSLSRDTTNASGTVAKAPDVNALLSQQADTMAAAQAAGQMVAQRITAYANDKQKTAQHAADAAKGSGNMDGYAKYQR
ncbi:hypothetical protein [Paraburkholderia bannensis]|uniref:hypothetical protein n=1 Tax=Paraburkholderia bannensis TaxID=765414 RepID=UPI002AB64BBE|nr:hypothetical protein [Paraburkholderia bannensis]